MADDTTFTKSREALAQSVEALSRTTSVGSLDSSVSAAIYGINHRRSPGALPKQKEFHGLVLMTKPRLNFSDENIRNSRLLAKYATGGVNSLQNVVRCTLDPDLQRGRKGVPNPVRCDVVDPYNAFIPFVTNTIESLSGFPNMTAYTYTTPEGIIKEAMSWVDGPSFMRGTYDLNLSLRNVVGDLGTSLFEAWGHSMYFNYVGKTVPYPEYMMGFERDFDSRLWVLNLDSTMRFVHRISSTIVFPLDAPNGVAGNFERERIFAAANDQISISLRAHGYETGDYILYEEFNATVAYANPEMANPSDKSKYYVKIPPYLLKTFNGMGYPWIDLENNFELTWWVPMDMFYAIVPKSLYEEEKRAADVYNSSIKNQTY